MPTLFLLVHCLILKENTCETRKMFLFHFKSSSHSRDFSKTNFRFLDIQIQSIHAIWLVYAILQKMINKNKKNQKTLQKL